MSVADVLAGTASHHVACASAEDFLDSLPDGCVSLMPLDVVRETYTQGPTHG